jgi:hypothetical protein
MPAQQPTCGKRRIHPWQSGNQPIILVRQPDIGKGYRNRGTMPLSPAGPGNGGLSDIDLLASQGLIGGNFRLAGEPRQGDRALFKPPDKPRN